MVQSVDPQVGDITDPVADLGPERMPECEVAGVIGCAEPNAVEFDDAGIPRGKIAPSASGRPDHQIDPVAGCILGQQRRLHVAALALAGGGLLGREAGLT